MPSVINKGVRIHYHVEGRGAPLVLQHGALGSLQDWYESEGLISTLGTDHSLILIDSRGHGFSDKPHEKESYSLELLSSDVVAVLDDLGVAKTVFMGYSMGGWIGLGLAIYSPSRLDGLIVGGAHPYARSFQDWRDGLCKGMESLAGGIFEYAKTVAPGFASRLYHNDAQAILALQQDRSDISDAIAGLVVPCLIYSGESDPIHPEVQSFAAFLPNAKSFSMPELDHLKAAFEMSVILPNVRKFLSDLES